MSLTPRLTLIGLYKYDPSLFANLELPSSVDNEIFINSLMLEYGECPLIYPDYDFMKLAIGVWSHKWYDNIERIARAIKEEYDPLYNYDRTETWTENEEGTKDFTRGIVDGESESENNTINENGTVNRTETENGTDENLVSAFNETEYQSSTKTDTESENEQTTSNTKTTTANKTDRIDRNTDEKYNENNGRQNVKSGHCYGNIGVTTSTEMLQKEIDIRRIENLYHIIAELFYREFCIYVF